MNSPSAIATWANAITVSRILLAPVMFAMIPDVGGSWPATVVWFLLCSSDFIDGWVARRHGVTRSGAFLDPLADKVLVDAPGVARSVREAPEIDGIVEVPSALAIGTFHKVLVTEARGPDLVAEAVL